MTQGVAGKMEAGLGKTLWGTLTGGAEGGLAVESFGIKVPGGHIEVLEAAAEHLNHVARSAERTGDAMRRAAKVDGWEGAASKAFTHGVTAGVKPADIAEKQLPHAAKALMELADDLRIARRATREAVEHARTADHRHDVAQRQVTEAQTRLTNRHAEATDLQRVIEAATARCDHATETRQALHDVKRAAHDAERDLSQARRHVEKAAHDLKEAQRDGRLANERYDHACHRAAKRLHAVAAAAPGAAKGDAALTWKDAYAVMRVGWRTGDRRVSGREVAAGLLAVFDVKKRVPVPQRGDFWKLVTPQLQAIMSKEKAKKNKDTARWSPAKGGKDHGALVGKLVKGKALVGNKAFFLHATPIVAADPVTGGTPAPPE